MLVCVGQALRLLVLLASMATAAMGLEDASRGPLAIPRLEWGTEQAFAAIADGLPCILSGISLIESVVGKWTIPYLRENFGGESWTVFASKSERFQYWSDTKAGSYAFPRPTENKNMTFAEFAAQMHSYGDESMRLYLQQALVVGVGDQILRDFQTLGLEAAVALKQLGGWRELTTNLLLVAPRGAVTPAHYDEQENIFGQIHGRKYVRLFAPGNFDALYPFPLDHPCDRQSQLIIPAAKDGGKRQLPTNAGDFPNFEKAQEYAATLEEGDVLYIPSYWWHQIESITDNVSMTWWFKAAAANIPSDGSTVQLQDRDKVALRRNIERLLGQLVEDAQQQQGQDYALST